MSDPSTTAAEAIGSCHLCGLQRYAGLVHHCGTGVRKSQFIVRGTITWAETVEVYSMGTDFEGPPFFARITGTAGGQELGPFDTEGQAIDAAGEWATARGLKLGLVSARLVLGWQQSAQQMSAGQPSQSGEGEA